VAIETDRTSLLDWFWRVKRDLPWRRTRDPYRIWISEIMLQQTRVDQAMPYYERFIARFPDANTLARADLDEVLRLWEGLGYYSRARNMHKAARQIAGEHKGRFPDTYEEVIGLRGIGPYTAAAIMSIAYDEPWPVVDGNVIRVISRLFGIGEDVRLASTQNRIAGHAAELLDRDHPGDFNQAMMELGATVCTPSSPSCPSCPFQLRCHAHNHGATGAFPYKSPAKKRPHHHIAVGVITDRGGRMLIARRPDNAMLGGLWEFPGGKQESGEELPDTVRRELREELGVDVEVDRTPFRSVRHAYSHFTITLHAFHARMKEGSHPPEAQNGEPIRWVVSDDLVNYAFPKANRKITETLMGSAQ
jgi:A/G-specific adenine glycosylase